MCKEVWYRNHPSKPAIEDRSAIPSPSDIFDLYIYIMYEYEVINNAYLFVAIVLEKNPLRLIPRY